MASWSKRRKNLYASIIIIVLVVAVGIPSFFYFYRVPSCFDGVKNGNEQGVDCGGSCERLCQSDFLPPSAAWTRFEEVAPGLYNLAAYIVNPNAEGEALNVPYRMVLYDEGGIPIADISGTVTIPPHRNVLAFIPAVSAGKAVPKKIFFEFTSPPDWHKRADPLGALSIVDKTYSEDATGSSLSVILKNNSVYSYGNIAVYVVLYDTAGNALGFSRTVIDSIPGESEKTAPFTWPLNRAGKVISIEVLPVAE